MKPYRNWMNLWAGWFLAAGLLLFTAFVVDPLNVAQRADSDLGWGTFGLIATAVTMLFAMISFRLFTRSGVAVEAGTLRITNPPRQWQVPAELVSGTDDNLTYVRVHVGGRRILCVGLEKSNLSMLRGDRSIDERIEKAVAEARSQGHAEGPVKWRWTRPSVPEVVMPCLWAVYIAAGAIVSHR